MNIIIITYIFWLGHRKLVSHVVWFYEHKKADYLYQLHKLENVLILLAHWPETSQTLTLAPDDRLRGFTFSGIIDVNPLINNLSKLLIWVFHFTHWWSISTLKSCDGLKSISFTLFWLGHRGILDAISYQIMFPKNRWYLSWVFKHGGSKFLNYSSPNLQGQESIDYSCLCRAAHRINLEWKGLLKNILRNIGR